MLRFGCILGSTKGMLEVTPPVFLEGSGRWCSQHPFTSTKRVIGVGWTVVVVVGFETQVVRGVVCLYRAH